jgi:hypothetical protein
VHAQNFIAEYVARIAHLWFGVLDICLAGRTCEAPIAEFFNAPPFGDSSAPASSCRFLSQRILRAKLRANLIPCHLQKYPLRIAARAFENFWYFEAERYSQHSAASRAEHPAARWGSALLKLAHLPLAALRYRLMYFAHFLWFSNFHIAHA